MRIAKLHHGRQAYYLQSVAAGWEDHRSGALEPDGAWLGAGAAALGLAGVVGPGQLDAVLSGRHPSTEARLNPAQDRIKVVGFDLTLAAPKSVSVVFGLAEDPVCVQVRAGHEAAVADALAYLEREAAAVVRRAGGERRRLGVDGLVAAGFVHRTSRSADPHLHTHLLVANLARGHDGRWSALDGRGLYAHARTAGDLYQGRLRLELARRLGLEWGPVSNGVAQLEGIDPPVRVHFSTRRGQVEAQLAAWGKSGDRAAQAAALVTRPGKDQSRTFDSLREEWRSRASGLALSPDPCAWIATLGPLPGPSLGPTPAARAEPGFEDVMPAVDSLAARVGTLGRRQLLRAVVGALPGGATVETVEELAAGLVRSGALAERGAGPGGLAPGRDAAWRSRGGGLLSPGVHEAGWTTSARARREEELVRAAGGRADGPGAMVDQDVLESVLAARPGLDRDQVGAVGRLTGSAVGVEQVRADPGPWRSDVLEAARATWEASDGGSSGSAPARREPPGSKPPRASIPWTWPLSAAPTAAGSRRRAGQRAR